MNTVHTLLHRSRGAFMVSAMVILALTGCDSNSEEEESSYQRSLRLAGEEPSYGGPLTAMVPNKYIRIKPAVIGGRWTVALEFRSSEIPGYSLEPFRAFVKVDCFETGSSLNDSGRWYVFESYAGVNGSEDQWGRKRVMFGESQVVTLAEAEGLDPAIQLRATKLENTSPVARRNPHTMFAFQDESIVLMQMLGDEGGDFGGEARYRYLTKTPTGCAATYSLHVRGLKNTFDPTKHYHFFHAKRFLEPYYRAWIEKRNQR